MALIAFLSAVVLAWPQTIAPPRDAASRPPAPAAEGSATIRGRITDRETGRPIPRSVVKLAFLGPGTQQWHAIANDDGSYVFAKLPAGSYNLYAEPPERTSVYLSQRYGQSERAEPQRNSDLTSSITLARGETTTADIALSKALTIEGRVLGDRGEPLANIRVVLEYPGARGVAGPARTTDDRGTFRLFGIRPGEYRLCADPGPNLMLIRSKGPFDGEQLLKTCYPGLPTADGRTIPVDSDVSGADIQLQRGRVYTVSGIVIDAAGAPFTGTSFSFTKRDSNFPSSTDVRLTDGQFVVRGVPPGDYELSAQIRPFESLDKREFGTMSVRVEGADVEGLVLQMSKAVTVAGRVEFEGGIPAARPIVNVNTRSQPGAVSAFQPPSRVGEDLTFSLSGLFGRQVLQVFGAMRPWVVKAIRYRGDDVFGRWVEFKNSSDANDLVVVLTNRGAWVSGRVELPADAPRPNAVVALLPLASARQDAGPLVTVTATAVEKDGTYKLPPVRAGDYLIIAAAPEDVPSGVWQSEPFALVRLAKAAERITLAEDDQRTIDLKLVRPR